MRKKHPITLLQPLQPNYAATFDWKSAGFTYVIVDNGGEFYSTGFQDVLESLLLGVIHTPVSQFPPLFKGVVERLMMISSQKLSTMPDGDNHADL